MKKLILIILLFTNVAQSQTVKDFFIPTAPKNKATFYGANKKLNATRTIFYTKRGGLDYILDAKAIGGNTTAIITRTITFSDTKVMMTKSETTNIMETNVHRNHNPPEVLLKMPPNDKTVSWSTTRSSGDVYNYTASWTTLNIDGKAVKTIKVEIKIKGFEKYATFEYYVQGIGYYKTDSGSGSFQIFDKLVYDPTAK